VIETLGGRTRTRTWDPLIKRRLHLADTDRQCPTESRPNPLVCPQFIGTFNRQRLDIVCQCQMR